MKLWVKCAFRLSRPSTKKPAKFYSNCSLAREEPPLVGLVAAVEHLEAVVGRPLGVNLGHAVKSSKVGLSPVRISGASRVAAAVVEHGHGPARRQQESVVAGVESLNDRSKQSASRF